MTVDFHNTQTKVREWAQEKGIGGPDDLATQGLKLLEECQECYDELFFGEYDKAKMELGDCLVVCTILAMKLGSNVEECLGMAYEKIKARKGKTINGIFVKEE